ncbi:MAG: DUF2818 family protein [Oxalobacteraceae bacterium]
MNTSTAAWLIIFLMGLAANFPFFTESLFGVVRLKSAHKPFVVRLFEMLLLYLLVVGIARGMETLAGNAFPQGWQFYTVTLCLMLVLAFPGFVWRHLRRRPTGD